MVWTARGRRGGVLLWRGGGRYRLRDKEGGEGGGG